MFGYMFRFVGKKRVHVKILRGEEVIYVRVLHIDTCKVPLMRVCIGILGKL